MKRSFLVFCLIFCPIFAVMRGSGQSGNRPSGILPSRIDTSEVTVSVDLNRSLGAFTPIDDWFGYDESNYTTTPHGQKLLKELHGLSPVPVYIRAHFLLTSGNGKPELKWSSSNVYTEDAQGQPQYHWKILDGIFDAYAAAHVRPMVELGFMPEALSSHPEPYHVPWPAKPGVAEGWSFPPRDYSRWRELTFRVAEHMAERYGMRTVSTWYWEVWNEPNIGYWHGTEREYERLYDYAAAGVRQAIPQARIGGPATTGPSNGKAAEFLKQFLSHCAKDTSAATGGAIPLDFISFHVKGTTSLADGHVRMDLQRELAGAEHGFAIVRGSPEFQRLPIILSEADPEGCAACVSTKYPQNGYRNGSMYPAYTAAAMKSLLDISGREHVNLIGMLTWAFEFEGQPYFAGFRSLATNGVDKPELNFFRMAGILGGERVEAESGGAADANQILASGVGGQPDVDALATAAPGAAAVMLWNYEDQDAAGAAADLRVAIRGFPKTAQRVLVEQYRIDDEHSNAYTAWLRMGSPQKPTPRQYAELQAAGQLALLGSPQWMTPHQGVLQTRVTLPRESLALLRITWTAVAGAEK